MKNDKVYTEKEFKELFDNEQRRWSEIKQKECYNEKYELWKQYKINVEEQRNTAKARGFAAGLASAFSIPLAIFAFVLPVTIVTVGYWTGMPVFALGLGLLGLAVYFIAK